jgi:hypothetical protein
MKYSLLAIATALIVTYSAESLAQSVEVEIAPESRTRIKEYVVRERVPSVRVRERITVGAVLPEEVELRTLPSDWGQWGTRYRYVYSDDNIYLVEPSSRRVVRVID